MIRLAVSIQHQRVTDERTDRRTALFSMILNDPYPSFHATIWR